MIINDKNTMEGNRAVASALLLYYHLAEEGCFCGDETVYIDPNLFDGFKYLDVVVEEAHNPEINEKLLREAAIIFLLCDLNDVITEHEDYFHSSDITKRFVAAFKAGSMTAIPEVEGIINLLQNSEAHFDFESYSKMLQAIHSKYILGTFKSLSR